MYIENKRWYLNIQREHSLINLVHQTLWQVGFPPNSKSQITNSTILIQTEKVCEFEVHTFSQLLSHQINLLSICQMLNMGRRKWPFLFEELCIPEQILTGKIVFIFLSTLQATCYPKLCLASIIWRVVQMGIIVFGFILCYKTTQQSPQTKSIAKNKACFLNCHFGCIVERLTHVKSCPNNEIHYYNYKCLRMTKTMNR